MSELPEVAGRMSRSIAELEHAIKVLLGEEQAKISPDTALISVLCDTVRFIREDAQHWKESLDLAALRRVLTRERLAETLYDVNPRIVPEKDRFLQQADAILALPEIQAVLKESSK